MYGNISSGNKHLLFGLTLYLLLYFVCVNREVTRLHRCVGLSEPSLVAYVISTKISRAGPYGPDATKPVFGVSVRARFKPVSSATETS